ncbi:accessory gene regulator ArgB-like protein [Kineothrix sp. MB12-C1]|uniref:accessory gene regulator ArgB-like protein n=1 Tax=Kineothrix sp. MB12-C1 TaxID=3070215 RepID=UPI0027D22056|nr:accessory gene regulator B family protein [Kineothrix sp. MB12-C1]WMC91906.1 accessory gene regulator B family protein [Kineothrix sp. MB12-C1]
MQHMLASKITDWCSRHNEMSETQAIAVTYGIELIFNSLFKVIGLVLLGAISGRMWDVIISLVCFSSLRYCAGGLHMKSNLGCFLSMVFVCVSSIAGAEYIHYLPVGIMVGLSIGIIIVNKLFAPFFTENNPIEDKKILRQKNIGAVVIAAVWLIIIWVLPDWYMKMLMLTAITLETLSILPLWHERKKADA